MQTGQRGLFGALPIFMVIPDSTPSPGDPVRVAVHAACEAMRTRFEFVLWGSDRARLTAAAEEAIEEIHACEARLSLFQPGSLISLVNREAALRPVVIDPQTFALLELARDVHHQSGGAFDITIGPLMRAWGFRGQEGEPQNPLSLQTAKWGMHQVILDRRTCTVRFANEGMELDLGAIGKGHALDLAMACLTAAGGGVKDALIHAGTSSILAIGSPPGEDCWRIALGPEPDSPIVSFRNAALGISAPRGRTLQVGDNEIGHILDPRTGKPCTSANTAAAIYPSVAPGFRPVFADAAAADAWSTAALVLGTDLSNRNFQPPPSNASHPTFFLQTFRNGPWEIIGDRNYAHGSHIPSANTHLSICPPE